MTIGTRVLSRIDLRSEYLGAAGYANLPQYGTGAPEQLADGAARRLTGAVATVDFGEQFDLGEGASTTANNPILKGQPSLIARDPRFSIEAPALVSDELPHYLALLGGYEGAYQPDPELATVYRHDWRYGTEGDAVYPPVSGQAIISDGSLHLFASGLVVDELSISASAVGTTSLSASGFAKKIERTEQAPSAPFPPISAPRAMAGRLWRAKLWSQFPHWDPDLGEIEEGGTEIPLLFDWTLTLASGVIAINSQVGASDFASYHPFANSFSGRLSLTIGSTPDLITPFLENRGGTIHLSLEYLDEGTPAHSAIINLTGIVDSVEPFGGDEDGISTYAIEIIAALDLDSRTNLVQPDGASVKINVSCEADTFLVANTEL